MAEPRLRGLRELQAVAQVVPPAAQVDGLPLPRFLLEPEHVDEEAEALLGLRGQELCVSDAGDVVQRLGHCFADSCSTSSRRPSRS